MDLIEKGIIAHGGKAGDPLLELDLDEVAYEGFVYSRHDLRVIHILK